jgi:hypothetical protein
MSTKGGKKGVTFRAASSSSKKSSAASSSSSSSKPSSSSAAAAAVAAAVVSDSGPYPPLVWRGFVRGPPGPGFEAYLTQIAGPSLQQMPWLPDDITCSGRINLASVVDFAQQVKNSSKGRRMCLLELNPTTDRLASTMYSDHYKSLDRAVVYDLQKTQGVIMYVMVPAVITPAGQPNATPDITSTAGVARNIFRALGAEHLSLPSSLWCLMIASEDAMRKSSVLPTTPLPLPPPLPPPLSASITVPVVPPAPRIEASPPPPPPQVPPQPPAPVPTMGLSGLGGGSSLASLAGALAAAGAIAPIGASLSSVAVPSLSSAMPPYAPPLAPPHRDDLAGVQPMRQGAFATHGQAPSGHYAPYAQPPIQ